MEDVVAICVYTYIYIYQMMLEMMLRWFSSYDMEMHMVHISADGRIAVIGILYDIGLLGDKFLGKVRLNKFQNVGIDMYIYIYRPNINYSAMNLHHSISHGAWSCSMIPVLKQGTILSIWTLIKRRWL